MPEIETNGFSQFRCICLRHRMIEVLVFATKFVAFRLQSQTRTSGTGK